MSGLEITTDGPTLRLGGDVDVRSTGRLRTAIYEHLRLWEGEIVLDVSAVTSVDVTALRVVAAACRRAADTGERIVLRGASARVLRMLHLTHLIRVVELDRDPIAV